MKWKYLISALFFWITVTLSAFSQGFRHPGLLNASEDIARMQKGIAGHQPDITAGYEVFKNDPESRYTYQMQGPLAEVSRNPTVGQTMYDHDANAAYQNAVMWAVTGDIRHAKKAIEIVDKWSESLKSIGGRDAVLMAGLGPFKMINAAELLRYTHSGWTDAEISKTEKHFKEVIYPVLINFSPFANGNWDSAALKTVMALAIFSNDRPMFESAIRYYEQGCGDGRLTNYIINEAGQCQESGRDQSHTQLGIAHLADCCEMAWHQGLDLYGYQHNLLLKGFEYTASYNLNNDVPFTPTIDRTGKYIHHKISIEGRGKLRAIYEEVYNHYVKRRGLTAPYTASAAAHVRPEAKADPGADHIGFGTFLYSRSGSDAQDTKPSAPAGLVFNLAQSHLHLAWVAVNNATSYTVRRSAFAEGPYQVIGSLLDSSSFTDKDAVSGRTYYYTVAAVNSRGEGGQSYFVSACNGLPGKWKMTDIGTELPAKINSEDTLLAKSAKRGSALFDGVKFTIDGVGSGLDIADHFTYMYQPLAENCTIRMRYVPQLSSQFTQFGLVIRQGLNASAPEVALMIAPTATGQVEAPSWVANLYTRKATGEKTELKSGEPFIAPVVSYGRLTGNVWLSIRKTNKLLTASYSTDGVNWVDADSCDISNWTLDNFGIAIASGQKAISTTVSLDSVEVTISN